MNDNIKPLSDGETMAVYLLVGVCLLIWIAVAYLVFLA